MNKKLNANFSMRKLLLTALVAGPLATLPAPLWALPATDTANLPSSSGITNIQVVGGTTLNITALDKAVLNWVQFGGNTTNTIAANETINYFLPSSTSSILNNVTGNASVGLTNINGTILSNGNVYVLNPNGIIIGNQAQIQVGGFYASTIPEPSSFFAQNGSLNFNGNATANVTVLGNGTVSGNSTTAGTATIQAVGPGNNIFLVGNAVDIQGGKFFGNLNIRATSVGASNLPTTSGGNSTYVSIGSTGPVSVNLLGVPLTQAGGLNIVSNGGNVLLTGAGNSTAGNTLTVAPIGTSTAPISINTTGTVANGNITQGSAGFIATSTGSVVTLNAGTGTTAGDISLNVVDFTTVGATGKNISLTDTSGGVTLNAITASGTLSVSSAASILQGSGVHSVVGNVSLAPTASNTLNFTATGNLSISNIATTSTIAITTSGDLSVPSFTASTSLALTSTGGAITAGSVSSATFNLTASSSAGKLTAAGIKSSTGTFNVAGDIAITTLNQAGGGGLGITSTAGSISITSIAAVGSALNLTASTGTITTGAITSASTITAQATAITLGNVTATNALTATASTGSITTGSISTTATVTLVASSSTGAITTGAITSGTRTVSLSSGGNISLTGGSIPVLSATSSAGAITQSGAIVSTSTATFNAAGDINLSNTLNNFTTVVLQGGNATATNTIVDANTIILGGGTNTKSATNVSSVTAGDIALGGAAIESVLFGSTLSLTTNGAGTILTNANNVSVFGNVSLASAAGNITLGNNALGGAANYTFGQVNATISGAGSLTVFENTTLNLGTITVGNSSVFGTLDARSGNGDIVNTGKLSLAGTVTVAAGNIFTQNNISLTNTSNALSTVLIGNAKDFTVVNGSGNLTVTAGTSTVNGKAATGNVSVTNLGVGNTVTINTGVGGDYSTVGFSAAGNVTVSDPNGLTIQNATATGAATSVSVSTFGPIVLGSGIVLSNGGNSTFTSTYSSGNPLPGITDSAPGIRIINEAIFVSDGNIAITQAGHSMGPVSLTTTGNAAVGTSLAGGTSALTSITYTEGGTVNLKTVSAGTNNYPGALTIVSSGGAIQQANATATITVPNASSTTPTTISFTASGAGAGVNLNGLNNITSFSPISITASGNSSITQSTAQNVTLGNIVVTGGTFGVDVSGTAGNTISQATGTTVKSYGAASFTTRGGKITLSNSGNNFGALTLVSNSSAAAGADIAVTESGVLNFASVNTGTAGKLTAQSENASIIQTGTGSVIVGGNTSLTAATGITLFTNTNDFGGSAIVLSTVGNVSLTDSNATTVLGGGTSIGGALSLRNTHTTGGINDGTIRDSLGNITVGGNVLLDTGSTAQSSILMNTANSSFGAVTFRSGNVTITESTTFNLGANSFAAGSVSITSSLGSIVTSGAGGSTFQKTLTLNASGPSGSITISNPIFVNGSGGVGLTFRAIGAVDLSILSLSGSLNNIAPTNLGASSYKPPQP